MNPDFIQQGKHRKYFRTDKGYNYLQQELLMGGQSFISLAKIFDINPDTLSVLAKENGLFVDNRQKYVVNSNYFHDIDTPEKAYWLGFLYADGCISKKSAKLILELQEQDELSLYKLRSCLDSSHPIKRKIVKFNEKTFHHSYIVIVNKILCNDLIKHGCIEKKSLILLPPSINPELYSAWILGYMDGDGSIKVFKDSSRQKEVLRLNISFTGTYEILSFIKSFFHSDAKIRHEHRCINNTYNFTITESASLNFLSEMYNTEPLGYMSLDRKRNKFIEYLDYKGDKIYGSFKPKRTTTE